MKRIPLLLVTALLVLMASACSDIKATQGKPGGLTVGDPAYDFKLMDSNGQWLKFSDIQPGWSLVIVLFRGTWCSACLTQMSEFKPQYQKFVDLQTGLLFASNEPVRDLAEFQKQWRFPFPIVSDPTLKLIDAYGARHVRGHDGEDISRPCVVIVDSNKTVRYKYIGATPQDHPHVAEVLDLVRKFKAAPYTTR